MFENLDKSVVEQLRHDPRLYAANFWRHPTDPSRKYDFKDSDGEKKVNYLLHDDGPLNPESWGNINVLKFARGCLKSTSLRIIVNWALHMYPSVKIYMTAPRENQIRNFTEDLKQNITNSGLDNRRTKDNAFWQEFEVEQEEGGQTYTVRANFKADSGWGDGDALRGPHSHIGIIDEFQDIDKPAFDTFMQCIDQKLPRNSYFPCIFILGTPKLTSSFYADLWDQTDQKVWDNDELTWEQHSEPASYMPDEEVMEDLGIDPDNFEPYTVRGWHVDQPNSPLHDERAIARDRANLSEMKFENEVMANFYSPEDNLLSEEHVRACFDTNVLGEEIGFSERRRDDSSIVTLAVDWGGGMDKNAADTVVMVAEHEIIDDAYRSTFLDIDFLESGLTVNEQIRRVEQKLIQYDVDRGVVDYGHGHQAMEDLQDGNSTLDSNGYIDFVKGCRFANVKDKTDVKFEKNSGKKRFFTVDKVRSMDCVVDAVKKQEFVFPTRDLSFETDSDDGVKLIKQLTAPYKELDTTPNGSKKIKIDKSDSRNDDAMDALTYTWIASRELGNMVTATTAVVNRRNGYA